MKKRVVVLGATGSIGESTMRVARVGHRHKVRKLELGALVRVDLQELPHQQQNLLTLYLT